MLKQLVYDTMLVIERLLPSMVFFFENVASHSSIFAHQDFAIMTSSSRLGYDDVDCMYCRFEVGAPHMRRGAV
jgi:hypothetical protein